MILTAKRIQRIPERIWLSADKTAKLIAFCPFRDSYGGWLIWTLNGKLYRCWCPNSKARELNAKEVYVYGKRAI